MPKLHAFANPARFLRLSARLKPWLAGGALLFLLIGLYYVFLASPPDYQQGETVRILYLHVPCAWLALGGYLLLALCSISFLVWKHPLAALAARGIAPLGALFTALCLATGMIWGKPTWGAWWVWDARLTSVLVLLFFYLGHIAVTATARYRAAGDHMAALVAILGVVNLPVVKFSVDWWQTLHQPASISRLAKPALHESMLPPLLWMTAGMLLLYGLLSLLGTENALFAAKNEQQRARAAHG